MEKKKFTKADLKLGYVIKLRCGLFGLIMPVGTRGSLIVLSAGGTWSYLSRWNDELCDPYNGSDYDIIAVYGFVNTTDLYHKAKTPNDDGRPLLWQRSEPKKMTVSEISKALGYEVEIVAETSKGE